MSLWGNTAEQPPEPKKFANISNDQINSNQQAVPVKYLAGRQYLAGDYISPAYNPKAIPIKTKTGKNEESTTGFKYYADFALVFCMGGRRPVDSIYKVIVDSDIRWTGNVSRGNSNKEVITVPDLGVIHLYWGNETQGIDNILLSPRGVASGGIDPQDSTTWPKAGQDDPNQHSHDGFWSGNVNPYSGHYDKHPAYRGQCYAVFKNWKLGRDRTSVPNIQLELKRGCPWIGGGGVTSTNSGVNPIAILYDWLTDTRFGMGLPESSLNTATFQSTYNQLESLGAKISPLISQQEDFRQVIAQLLEYFDGWIRRNGTKIEVGLWSHGTVTSSATLTDDDLLSEPELEPQGWGPTQNEITVVYRDKDHHFNDYTQVYRDPNNFRITGGPRPETLQRPWITDADLAKRYARESGAAAALPYTRGELTVKREWLVNHSILPGKIITFNSGFYGLSFLLRVQEIEHAADSAASAKMTVEWERSKWPALYVPPGFQGPGGFVLGPRAIWKSRITEVPYLLLDQRFVTQIVPLAIRGNVEVQGFRVWTSIDGGSTYQVQPNESSSSAFSSYGRTFGTTSATDTGFGFYLYGIDLDEVVTQTNAEWKDDNLICFIDAEVISIGRIISYGAGFFTAFIKRGRLGTAAAIHPNDSECYFIFRDRLRLLDNAAFIPGASIKFKLQPFTQDTDFDLNSITAITYVVSGFADIPPPVFDPAPTVFSVGIDVNLSTVPAGFKPRYERDGTPPDVSSPVWPGNGTGHVHLSNTATIRVRFFSDSGRMSRESIGTYTKVVGTVPTQQCGAPSWSFSGVVGHSNGQITLSATTQGSTIKYKKNGGATTNYSTPVTLNCNSSGDDIEFWASKAGMDDSAHRTVDNSRQETGGGGHHPPIIP